MEVAIDVYYLASPISNAPVESLLQLLKHGGGRYMELPALLQLMSLRTCKEAVKTVDVHDLQQHMGQLRADVRCKEDAAAAAQRSAKAERQITAAAHKAPGWAHQPRVDLACWGYPVCWPGLVRWQVQLTRLAGMH
ncbi:hypothetical protein HaLaN_08665 [Haematococcus lacustris]|uniref:Uncharacterized protein n=1 Tax=Haematococcus lacustris TaxID=44745 RepID=A0A699YSU4_HAELA|nr:hypothetical protein HaLaN_08665 [Haematococcus lacustris]